MPPLAADETRQDQRDDGRQERQGAIPAAAVGRVSWHAVTLLIGSVPAGKPRPV